jgi:predicted metal-dependent peptidase
MGEIVIGVDTSGSIRQAELDMFNAHINRILHTCNPEKVTVVYCDYDVNSAVEYEPDDFPVTLKLQGGGGTRFKPVFDYIDENGIDPEVVVYLTDGLANTDFTTPHETVWLTTHSEDLKFGTVIKFEE